LIYIAYLDEFGHVGPYISRQHPKHNDHPVFGLAGLVLPAYAVRGFGTWFFKRKCELLDWELKRSGKHPAHWEKKGSALYTTVNIEKYSELRQFTNRFLNKIRQIGGFVFYVGLEKPHTEKNYVSNAVYYRILLETIKRLNEHCAAQANQPVRFMLIMDEHDLRDQLITKAAQVMYRPNEPMHALIEPPFQIESHRYQTCQAADWIGGLIGRLSAYWVAKNEFSENEIFYRYFHERIKTAAYRSGIRSKEKDGF
jgi:hypothetical protein